MGAPGLCSIAMGSLPYVPVVGVNCVLVLLYVQLVVVRYEKISAVVRSSSDIQSVRLIPLLRVNVEVHLIEILCQSAFRVE